MQKTGNSPSQLLRWLAAQWTGILPGWLRAAFFGQPVAMGLEFSSDVKKIEPSKGRLIAPLSLLKGGEVTITPFRTKIVDAVLPESFFLKRIVEAPGTARKNLKTLVELDMVRQTPFRSGDVFWIISPAVKSGSGLAVTQWITRRSDMEQLRLRLESVGLRLRKVLVKDLSPNMPIADLSAFVAPAAARWRWVNASLASSAILLAGVIYLYPAWQASAELESLNKEIALARSETLKVRQDVDILRQHESERAAFLDIIFRRPRLSNALRDISVALPDSVWISNMSFSAKQLVVSGHISGSAANLVLMLSKKSRFGNPRLSGPVARAGDGSERFELTLDMGAEK